MPSTLLEQAIKYRELGWSIFPVKEDKKPAISSWIEYQKRYPTDEEIRTWWDKKSTHGIALVTGKLSGVVVIDDDRSKHDVEGSFRPSPTVTSRTGGGGWHYLYKHPGYEVKNSAGQIEQYVDVRGDGGYIVLPPSRNQVGVYEWSVSPFESELAELPLSLEQKTQSRTSTTPLSGPAWMQGLIGVTEGSRNNTAASLAGKLFHHLPVELWETAAWPALEAWNLKNSPQMEHAELRGVFDSVAKRAYQNPSKEVDIDKVFTPETWETLSARTFTPIEWLVQDLIPTDSLVLLASKSGIGKTLFILDIIRNVCAGSKFLNRYPCKRGKVLLLDGETGEREIHRRCKLLGFDEIPNRKDFHHLTTYELNLSTEQGLETLHAYIVKHGISAVIVDTLRPFSGGINENDGSEIREFTQPFMKMRDELEVTIIFLDHERKPALGESKRADHSQVVGSQDKIASVDVALSLKAVDKEVRGLHQTKARRSPRMEEPIFYRIDNVYLPNGEERVQLQWIDKKDVEETKLDEAKELIAAKLLDGEEYSREEFIEALKKDGVGKSNVETALQELFNENLIDRYKKEGARSYTYRKFPTS